MTAAMISDTSSLEGQFLIAMPGMGDTRFEKTVILVCAHSAEGAMGFILNKALADPEIPDFLVQLNVIGEEERRKIPPGVASSVLHTGGPVEPGRGFVLHSPDFHSDSTIRVTEWASLTATLEILREIAMGRGPDRFFLALGYSGWSAGQLEEEIGSNGWLVAPGDAGLLFGTDLDGKYLRAMQMMGINPVWLSAEAGHA